MAKAIAAEPSKLTDEALQELWGNKSNGVTDVGPGTLPRQEFSNGQILLAQFTLSIFANPDAATLADVERQWKQAIDQKIFKKNYYAVIRRVFAAIKPESYTTILNDKHCEQLLRILSEQFQLAPNSPSGSDWVSLNKDIKWALAQAGLGDADPIKANTAMWQLLAPSLKPGVASPAVASEDKDESTTATAEPARPTNLILYGPPGTGIVVLRKPNGSELPLPMSIIRELSKLVEEQTISAQDIRDGTVFDKVAESHLEKYIVNGYKGILTPLVEACLAAKTAKPDAWNSDVPKVLIIDEINRGNISRIFGELITLIETTKRQGMLEALEVTLPYSKERFTVPANLHIIGTMNTADRSLAGLDIALRRRFSFKEMEPQPEELQDITVQEDGVSVNIGEMLRAINQRIEALLDRDHRLGHAFFLSLTETPTLSELARIFREHIIPLLEEYFFEDWQRIHWVLNDHRKVQAYRFIRAPESSADDLFGTSVSIDEQRLHWIRNSDALNEIRAYSGIIKAEPDKLA